MALRVIEEIREDQIRHIPRILYHWRTILGSVAFEAGEKSYAHERAREAIRRHLSRKKIDAEVVNGVWSLHRVKYPVPNDMTYAVITADSASDLNKLAAKSNADVLIFLSSAIETVSDDSYIELASHAIRSEIGAVGGRICDSGSMVLNNGVLIEIKNLSASHIADYQRNLAANWHEIK